MENNNAIGVVGSSSNFAQSLVNLKESLVITGDSLREFSETIKLVDDSKYYDKKGSKYHK